MNRLSFIGIYCFYGCVILISRVEDMGVLSLSCDFVIFVMLCLRKTKIVTCRISSVISKMGFVFLEQGFSRLLVPVCISISICCSACGFVYQVLHAVELFHSRRESVLFYCHFIFVCVK